MVLVPEAIFLGVLGFWNIYGEFLCGNVFLFGQVAY